MVSVGMISWSNAMAMLLNASSCVCMSFYGQVQ